MMNMNPQQIGQQMMQQMFQQNPQLANSEQGRNFADIVNRGDMAAGERFAMNMIESFGMTKEQAIQQAQQMMQQQMQNQFGGFPPQPFMRR